MEGDKPPEYKGKFSNGVDEALYVMSLDGWATASSGDVQAPTGWFARISNTEQELAEVLDAFGDEFAEIGFTSPSSLLGHFLLREDEQGFVHAEEYDSEEELTADYERLDAEFSDWAQEDE